MKIALICSHGGHLTELLYLMDAFKEHDTFFITYDNIRTRNLEYSKYLFPNFGEKPYKMVLNLHKIIKILLKEKPDIIVSNGAEIAIPFFYLGKLLRKKTIFIECYTRIDTPTVTGKLVYPVCGLFLVLWPEMLEKYGNKAQYWGGMFNLKKSLSSKKDEGDYILVITGMHSGFDRLIKKMDEIAGEIDDRVLMQIGNSAYMPKNAEYFRFKNYDEIKDLIKEAKVVICQGAMTVMDSLYFGTSVITVPRLKQYGEHINDHQLIFAEKLKEAGLVTICDDIQVLENQLDTRNPSNKCLNINIDVINKLKNFIND